MFDQSADSIMAVLSRRNAMQAAAAARAARSSRSPPSQPAWACDESPVLRRLNRRIQIAAVLTVVIASACNRIFYDQAKLNSVSAGDVAIALAMTCLLIVLCTLGDPLDRYVRTFWALLFNCAVASRVVVVAVAQLDTVSALVRAYENPAALITTSYGFLAIGVLHASMPAPMRWKLAVGVPAVLSVFLVGLLPSLRLADSLALKQRMLFVLCGTVSFTATRLVQISVAHAFHHAKATCREKEEAIEVAQAVLKDCDVLLVQRDAKAQ